MAQCTADDVATCCFPRPHSHAVHWAVPAILFLVLVRIFLVPPIFRGAAAPPPVAAAGGRAACAERRRLAGCAPSFLLGQYLNQSALLPSCIRLELGFFATLE